MSTLYPSGSEPSRPNEADDVGAGVRPGTIIWGVVTIVIGALILFGEVANITLNPVIVAMTLLIGTGLALVVGGVLSMTRRNGRSSD